jgi:predicted ATPase/class 3 adenylate cyclase
MDDMVSFGYWVRRRRKALDLTQGDLARRVGCAEVTIQKIEADERRPARPLAERLAEQLAIPADERAAFLQCARAKLAVNRLVTPIPPIAQPAPSPATIGPTRAAQSALPSGMVTFLFTDIEGSTPLWEHEPEQMRLALARHHAILRTAITAQAGQAYKTIGDAFQAAFVFPMQAVAAALAAQRALAAQDWETSQPLRVRIGVHVGPAAAAGNDYSTTHTLNRVARIMSSGHGGQILLSVEVADVVRRDLPADVTLRDMGKQRMKGLTHLEHLFQVVASDLPATFPPLKTLDTFRTNLPAQLTSFVGREQAITDVTQLLTTSRLVTLTGPGGTGKTRLALQVAAGVLEAYFDGVWLIELAPLADAALVPQAVATALGLREDAGRPILATLTDFLSARNLLLILDNCEHVVEECAQLADTLLHACPNLRILASSREALGLAGEAPFRVPSLATPDLHRLPPIETLADYEAVLLFVERATTVLPGFRLTSDNAPAVAQVCSRLDGIPLALELAAARVNVLRIEQIAARLDDRFRLLTGGSRTAVPRQQTLRALIDWSYDLLVEPERVLLRRLSVFAGGWTLEAAEAVCAGDGLDHDEVLDVLAQLVNKSLVVADREQGQETRYRLLETIRQYALERLVESGETDAVQWRHTEYCLLLVTTRQPDFPDAPDVAWLSRMEVEHDNLRAVLAWSLGQGEMLLAGRLTLSLEWFWFARGHISEGRRWLDMVLSKHESNSLSTSVLAIVNRMAGYFAYFQGDYGRAKTLFETSLSLFRNPTDKAGVANLLVNLGMVAEAQGDNAQAQAFFAESLGLRQEVSNKYFIADSLYHLGRLTLFQSNLISAKELLEEALALFLAVESGGMIPIVMGMLGYTLLLQGETPRAIALFREALSLLHNQGNTFMFPYNLIGLAGTLGTQHQAVRAARLIGAAEGLGATTGLRPSQGERIIWEHIIASIRAQLDEATFTATWAEGQAMTMEQAIAYALDVEV